ncbi:MAG: T9SS type A sorting domain-containing protein [Bacteroidetes bacterium]|nr:T9SS type A sorting domain-containing protein [Bacteroidota bacterium]
MIKNYFFFFFYIIYSALHAQVMFQKTFGGTNTDWAYSVEQTSDRGFIMVGFTGSFGAGFDDAYLLKTDSLGVLQWEKTYGGTEDDYGFSVQQTNDGGFIVAGWTHSFGMGYSDIYLVKASSGGSLQWSKTFGGTSLDYATSVQQTSDGGYIIVGLTESFGSGLTDIYLLKTDSNGSLKWTAVFGGTNDDEGRAILQTNDGGFIITGGTKSFGAGDEDIYLLKTDSAGILQWTKTIGGTGGEEGYSLQQTNDGGYIITGNTNSFGSGNDDIYLIKTASDGTLQWSKTFDGSKDDIGFSVQKTNDAGFIITGLTNGFGSQNTYLLKTDSNGTFLWAKVFIPPYTANYGQMLQQTSDGGFIIVGGVGGQYTDVYLIKTDSIGNSGCYETSSIPIISNGGIQSSGGIQTTGGIMITPPTQVDTGGVETVLCYTGTDEITKKDFISVYPNPSSGIFTIQLQDPSTSLRVTAVDVYNVFGEKVTRSVIPSGARNLTIDISNQPQGIYFLKVSTIGESASGGKTSEGTVNKKIIITR